MNPFRRYLEKIVNEEAERLTNNLASGMYTDMASYREHVGQLRSLVNVLEWCHDVQDQMDKA